MADVFISYKSERRNAAQHLKRILELHGYTVWFDYALLTGRDFARQIETELTAAKAVVVLWCTRSVQSDWVINEAYYAKENGKFIPVWIETATLPFGFQRDDTINLAEWDASPRSPDLDRLFDQIAHLVARDPVPDMKGLRDHESNWKMFGAPSLATFALDKDLEADVAELQSANAHAMAATSDQKEYQCTPRAAEYSTVNVALAQNRIADESAAGMATPKSVAPDMAPVAAGRSSGGVVKWAAFAVVVTIAGGSGVTFLLGEKPSVPTPAVSPVTTAPVPAPAPTSYSASAPPGLSVANVKLWERAIRSDAAAQYELALSYMSNDGVPHRDYPSAVSWLSKSAASGNGDAKVALGKIYLDVIGGDDILRDAGLTADDILAYLVQAHEQKAFLADLFLGRLYLDDPNSKIYNERKAIDVLKPLGYSEPDAVYYLAKLFESPRQVQRDLPAAISLYKMAAKEKHAGAIAALKRLGVKYP